MAGRISRARATTAGSRYGALAAALLAVAVYANSLGNGMVLDDNNAIAINEAAHHPLEWRRILLTPSWFAEGSPTIAYRPLTTWTFALDHTVHGGRPFGYHLVNVLGHATVSGLLVSLAASLGLSASTAGLAGALFAVHPVHTEVVANGVGRADILAAGLAMVALLAWRGARGRPGWLVGAAAAYGLALLAKEHAIALLVLLPLSDLLLVDGGSPSVFVRRLRGARAAFYVGLVVVTAGYLALRSAALGDVIGGGGAHRLPFFMNPAAHASAALRGLTALKVQGLALWLLAAPLHLSADYSYRTIPVVSSPAEPGAIGGLVVAAALVALAIVLWRSRVAFFWLALSLATYGVVSNVVVPIGTIFGERLLYLPSAGFCALVAMGLARAPRGWMRAAAWSFAAALVVTWGVRTALRNPVWHDNLRLAEATVASAPDSTLAHYYLGTTFWELGREQEALEELAHAIAIDPAHVDALYNTGVIHMLRQRPDEALHFFRRVIDVDPRHFASWVNMAAIHNSRGDFRAGIDAAEHAVAIRPDTPNGYVMKGVALRFLGRLGEARASFQTALRLPHAQADALLGLGATALEQGDFAMATRAFEELARAAPSPEAYRGLVASYRSAGREGDAARAAATARQRFPDDPSFAPGS